MKEKSRILKKANDDQSRPVAFNDSFGGGDNQLRSLLKYLPDENFKDINTKFDLIVTTHSLEHLTNIDIFSKFNDILNPTGFLFFEVPNCPKEYFQGRPYDSPHLLFFTSKK